MVITSHAWPGTLPDRPDGHKGPVQLIQWTFSSPKSLKKGQNYFILGRFETRASRIGMIRKIKQVWDGKIVAIQYPSLADSNLGSALFLRVKYNTNARNWLDRRTLEDFLSCSFGQKMSIFG